MLSGIRGLDEDTHFSIVSCSPSKTVADKYPLFDVVGVIESRLSRHQIAIQVYVKTLVGIEVDVKMRSFKHCELPCNTLVCSEEHLHCKELVLVLSQRSK